MKKFLKEILWNSCIAVAIVFMVALSLYLNYLWYGITPGLKWLMGW